MRRIERDARESSGTYILVDEETGEEFEVPNDAFLRVLCADEGEPNPSIEAILPTEDDPYRLERLYYDGGKPFWLYPTRRMNANQDDLSE